MVTPEELCAQAGALYDARMRREQQRVLVSDTEIIAEAPTPGARGPSVLVLMRSMLRRKDARGRERAATYFLQGANIGPEGRRDACTAALLIHGEALPLVAEMFARAMQIERSELEAAAREIGRRTQEAYR